MRKYGKDRGSRPCTSPASTGSRHVVRLRLWRGDRRFKNGKWVGTLDSPQAITALTRLKSIVRRYSKASKTGDEANPSGRSFRQGKVGSIIGNGWEWGLALDTKKSATRSSSDSQLGAYPMPSHTKGKFMPTFLGGSDLAIP